MKRRTFFKGVPATLLAAAGIHTTLQANTDMPITSGPYHYRKTLESTRQIPGFALSFVVTKEQTGGAYAIIEGKGRKGAEPGYHVHEHEDEAFYMLDGEMMVTIGEEEFHVKPGDYIFLPRRIPHTQKFLTDTVHVLLYISPAGLEEYFYTLSAPAKSFEAPALPANPDPPSEEMMKMMMETNARYGISFVERK